MTIPPEKMKISDDTRLADLTVGEFKQLIQSLMQNIVNPVALASAAVEDLSTDAKKMSLDELMNDLEG